MAVNGALARKVFEEYPYAILVEDSDGHLLSYNRAAAHLFGTRLALDVPGRLGCELLGCRRAGGPFERICLHQRALEHDGPLPEVRIDLPPGGSADAAWVTASALGDGSDRIVIELRPGSAKDRRRRTDPHWTTRPQLRISVLGRMRVLSAEGPLDGRWLVNRPGQVLKYLITERERVVYADEIVEKLWPNATLPSTRGLRYVVHVLREHLEPGRTVRSPSSFVLSTRGGYALDHHGVWIDASDFEEHMAAGMAALAGGDDRAALDRLGEALKLYRGDFLADEPYAEWALRERERLREVAGDGLRALASLKQRTGDIDDACNDLDRLTELEPFDVDVHRELLILLLRRGRRTQAMRRFNALRHSMLTTFGEELDFTLSDLLLTATAADRSAPEDPVRPAHHLARTRG